MKTVHKVDVSISNLVRLKGSIGIKTKIKAHYPFQPRDSPSVLTPKIAKIMTTSNNLFEISSEMLRYLFINIPSTQNLDHLVG